MMDNVLFLDIEGTGLDPANDRIVELAMYPVERELRVRRINPGVPIPPEVTAVHGITNEHVKDCSSFRSVSAAVQNIVDGKVLCGFNNRRYDTLLLDAELRRAGQRGLPRDREGKLAVLELDLYQIWLKHEPRTLVGAARRFAAVELGDNAHSADADTGVLQKILDGMIDEFILDGLTMEELCAECVPPDEVDRDRKFIRKEDGTVVFNIGESVKGKPATSDRGFLEWMLRKDFSPETKGYARRFLNEAIAKEEAEREAVRQEQLALLQVEESPFAQGLR